MPDWRGRLVHQHWPRSGWWWRRWDVGLGGGSGCRSCGGGGGSWGSVSGGDNGRTVWCRCWGWGRGRMTPVSLDESGSSGLGDVGSPEDDHVGVVLINTVKDWKAGRLVCGGQAHSKGNDGGGDLDGAERWGKLKDTHKDRESDQQRIKK